MRYASRKFLTSAGAAGYLIQHGTLNDKPLHVILGAVLALAYLAVEGFLDSEGYEAPDGSETPQEAAEQASAIGYIVGAGEAEEDEIQVGFRS